MREIGFDDVEKPGAAGIKRYLVKPFTGAAKREQTSLAEIFGDLLKDFIRQNEKCSWI